jgi:hypothetical protein
MPNIPTLSIPTNIVLEIIFAGDGPIGHIESKDMKYGACFGRQVIRLS